MLTSGYNVEEIKQRLAVHKGDSLSQKELFFLFVYGFLGKKKAEQAVARFFYNILICAN